MKIASMIAIYFVTWWIVLFAVLPFGVKNAHEADERVEEGHDPGAPVHAMLWRKAAATTIISAIVFGGIYWALAHGLLG